MYIVCIALLDITKKTIIVLHICQWIELTENIDLQTMTCQIITDHLMNML